jgi:predicted nucleic acid-binding protein
MLVVDASVAVKWLLDQPGDREARALVEGAEALIAPELIVAEVLNAIWKRLLAGDADIRQGPRVAAALPKVLAQIGSLAPLAARALELRRRCATRRTLASTSRSSRSGAPSW